MKRQTVLGALFILIGMALLVVVCAPVVVAIRAKATLPDLSLALVVTGLATTLFGAWLLPSSGVGATTVSIFAVAGPYLPFGRRANSGEVQAPPKPDGEA